MIDEAQIVPYHTIPLPSDQGPWIVFAPHADDETFGMGATIELAVRAGIEVHVVVVTDGALGGAEEHDTLIATRQAEARAAASVLGVSAVHFMGQADRGLANTFTLQAKVAQLIRSTGSKTVFFPGPLELHPDHRTCALLVWDACRGLNDPDLVVVSYEITVQNPVNCLVDITAGQSVKHQALQVYLSQLGENNYADIVKGLNVLRTLTLGSEVKAVEGYYRYSWQDRAMTLQDWLIQWAGKFLAQ